MPEDQLVPGNQHDDAAPVGADSARTAAVAGPRPLPDALGELTAELESLVEMGAEYAAQKPAEAKAGVWWWGSAVDRLYRMTSAEAQHREASVLALFWPGEKGPQVLLTERSPHMAKHPGQISFPGGGVEEADEDAARTALREAQEETGLEPSAVKVLGALPPAPIPISGFNVTPVLAVAEDPGSLVPQTGEVSRVLKLPVAELVQPGNRYTAVVTHRGPRLPSPAFMRISGDSAEGATEPFFIWGFTGTLLDRMLTRLRWAGDWDRTREIDPRDFRRR